MRCPTLKELPPSPPDKKGWPWTEEYPQMSGTLPDNQPWPRISIVTPSYNQGSFIEETIRSVLLQGYPDLEYMVFDGGSEDGTVEIIQKYSPWITDWVSEPDRGQAHAINKGFSRSTGDLLAWLNSDDFYLPGALKLFAEHHIANPQAILMGDVENFSDGKDHFWLTKQFNISFRNIVLTENEPWSWHQPGMFVPGPLSMAVGPLDEDLRYAFDLDWLLRLLQHAAVSYLQIAVARFRFHDSTKTTAEAPAMTKETHHLLRQRYWAMIPDLDAKYEEALFSLRMASIYLAYYPKDKVHWNRVTGMQQLLVAFMRSPRVLTHPAFLKLCRRAVLPKCLLRSNPWRFSNHSEN